MEDFKILTEDEFNALSSAERRQYTKIKRLYDENGNLKELTEDEIQGLSSALRNVYLQLKRKQDNAKLVTETANQVIKEVPAATPSETITATKPASVAGKKSNAGRPPIDDAEKKQQIMLTIEAGSKLKLESVDAKNYKKLLGRYIDKNIDKIVEAIEQL